MVLIVILILVVLESRCKMKEFIEKLVSRLEEEIDIIKDEVYRDYEERIIEECAIENVIDIVNELAEEYSANTSQNSADGWIPCSERLPEDGQWVIFTLDEEVVDNDDVMVGYYEASKNWCVNDAYFPNAFRFIAWQPLPAPYKEGVTENE